jgi:anti-sigma regulatory factor (Ser/Thr protein kinase)
MTHDALLNLRLPSRVEAASAARKALASLNGDLHLISEARLFDAQLLTSELVTNAVRATPDDAVHVRVRASDAILRVEVASTGASFDPSKVPGPRDGQPGGWGLRIVDVVARRWGADPQPGGVTVWFEIDRPSAETPLPVSGEAPPPEG